MAEASVLEQDLAQHRLAGERGAEPTIRSQPTSSVPREAAGHSAGGPDVLGRRDGLARAESAPTAASSDIIPPEEWPHL
jgi:hypothetical protein